jgi:hypothetical protein
MKRLILVLGALAAVPFLRADGGPAYIAINAAQKTIKAPAVLVELTGERGEPRPAEWKLIYRDPAARGGVREFVTADEAIVSERTPLRGYSGLSAAQPISLERLKIDSDGAFEIANRQAAAKRVGFNWIDYTLRANQTTGAPMWILRLSDSMGAQVGVLQISAEDGSILQPLQASGAPRHEDTSDPGDDSVVGRKIGGVIGTVGGVVERSALTVRDVTLRTAGTVQEILTGERTIGPVDDSE